MTGTDFIPTHNELVALITKIAGFFKNLLKIFEEVIAGLKLDYGDYERQIEDDTTAAPAIEEE